MAFSISSNAAALYREIELGAKEGIRLFVKYAGSGDSGGFSLGAAPGTPSDEDYVQEVDGLRFFVKPHELWLVDNMKLDYDKTSDRMMCEFPGLA
ncbi:HesB/YadR/YfhF family protein [Fictibacillus aquaticus]|uniref:HesB/YadR/YfhF family protein n=1 Tax=Fictibacillus aquaticus TaxID=2021314 RepID=UPI0013FE1DDB|nr:iron-sulfur cluster biosynthesis family protein [Fictibacillus aquaticus]